MNRKGVESYFFIWKCYNTTATKIERKIILLQTQQPCTSINAMKRVLSAEAVRGRRRKSVVLIVILVAQYHADDVSKTENLD